MTKLNAIFFDMDETLCDTKKADSIAQTKLASELSTQYPSLDALRFCDRYVAGFYKRLLAELPELNALLTDEAAFRVRLVQLLFAEQGIAIDEPTAREIQQRFDSLRFAAFDFFPEIKPMLARLRKDFSVGVITNGPQFSQRPKIDKVGLATQVDFILVGGEQPEEKPAASIFARALALADCKANEAIMVGDSFACDVLGAHNAGIASIWLTTPACQAQTANAPLATYIIHSPANIEDTLLNYRDFLLKTSTNSGTDS